MAPADIDKKYFENLCGMFCTLDEIASFFDCTTRTIQNWCKKTYGKPFSDVYKEKSAKGKISLRQAQLKIAQHNAQMAMWLGKQYLDQADGMKDSHKVDDTQMVDNPKTVLDIVQARHKRVKDA